MNGHATFPDCQAGSFYPFSFGTEYLLFIGSSSGILYALNFNNGEISYYLSNIR